MKINQAGIDLIKQFEGCKLTAYKCPAGVWTVGWGQTGEDIREGLVIDQETADQWLEDSLEDYCHNVEALLTVEVNESQFSALVCFAYNVGVAALSRSRLLEYLNAGKVEEASQQFIRWNKSKGAVLPGLTRRRQAEAELFRS